MTDDNFRAPQSAITDKAPARSLVSKVFIFILIFIVLAVGFFIVQEERAQQQYRIKARLSKILSAIDPIKTAIAMSYQETGKMPPVKTVVTQSNQGKPATPDWTALGFDTLPSLPREIGSLSVAPAGEIVVVIANIREGIDNTEVRITPAKDATTGAWTYQWTYQCTSEDSVLKSYFHC